MKKLLFATVLGAYLMAAACGGNATDQNNQAKENQTDSSELVKQETPKQKTREQLIINRQEMTFADPENPSDFELKHTPEIVIGETGEDGMTEISVNIGSNKIVHPSQEDHWIDFIAIYLDGTELEKREQPNNDKSNHTVFLANLNGVKKIKVTAGCNLHGIWSNEVDVATK